MHVGIDVGSRALHVVAVDDDLRLVDSLVVTPGAPELARRLAAATTIAIDAPDRMSTAPHRDDESLGRKYRTGRCAEVELGRRHGYWVSWPTPIEPPISPWMEVGFELFRFLPDAIEIFPYAGYRHLAGGARLPKKSTPAGLESRVALLRKHGFDVQGLGMWSHDSLDAALGALIAQRHSSGQATKVTCGHDGSAIWLP